MTLIETIQDIQHQLAWRGPGGAPQGHVVIGRDQAADIIEALLEILAQAAETLDKLGPARAAAAVMEAEAEAIDEGARNRPEQPAGTA